MRSAGKHSWMHNAAHGVILHKRTMCRCAMCRRQQLWWLSCRLLCACAVLQIMVASTTAFLAAGKFGLAPTVKRGTDAACKLQDRPNAAGLISNDPSGEQTALC
jgi:photosystem I reaction center PsaK